MLADRGGNGSKGTPLELTVTADDDRESILRAMEGESPLDQELAATLIRSLAGKAAADRRREEAATGSGRQPLAEPLAKRELEVLRLLAQGRSNPDITHELVIAGPTAKTRVERTIRKLGVSDRTTAWVRAIDLGLLGTEYSQPRPQQRQTHPAYAD